MFNRYLKEICPQTMESEMVRFVNNWNIYGKQKIQNIGKEKLSNYTKSSESWISPLRTTPVTTGINLGQRIWMMLVIFHQSKIHDQWDCDSVTKGHIVKLKPLCWVCFNYLLPETEREDAKKVYYGAKGKCNQQ